MQTTIEHAYERVYCAVLGRVFWRPGMDPRALAAAPPPTALHERRDPEPPARAYTLLAEALGVALGLPTAVHERVRRALLGS